MYLYAKQSKEKSNSNKDQHKRRSPRSPEWNDLRSRLRSKREKSQNHSHRHTTENKMEPSKISSKDNEMPDETIAAKQISELTETKQLEPVDESKPPIIKTLSDDDALEEGEIDDNSNGIGNDFKSTTYKSSDSQVLSTAFEGKLELNAQNVHEENIKIEENNIDMPNPIPVSSGSTEETHSAGPMHVIYEENCLHQQEQQQHDQVILNDIAVDTVEVVESEGEKLNGLAAETQPIEDDSSCVKLPFVNESEIIEMAKNQNQLEIIVKDDSNSFITEQPEAKHEPQPTFENILQPIESIPHINDGISSSQTNNTMAEPMDDGSNGMHNTSGSKSVNISTSSKDYLIIENDNNEQIIYVTRKKKKKKKKKSLENT